MSALTNSLLEKYNFVVLTKEEAAWEDYESAPEKGVIKFFPLGHRMNMWWCLFLLEKLLEERGMS